MKQTMKILNMKRVPKYVQDKFFDKIFYCMSGCWIWVSARNNGGYGKLVLRKQSMSAHRLSYKIHKGNLGRLHVLHSCDNTLCVNPDHLFLGTHKDNMEDKIRKMRHNIGEKNGISKLDKLQVLVIKQCRENGISQNKLARYFNVDQSLISYIDSGKIWNHIKTN